MPKIQIFTTPSCGYCNMAKEYFESKNLQYEEYNVTVDVERRNEMIQKTGQFGVPVIIIGGDKLVLGFNRPAIDRAINDSESDLNTAV